MEIIKMSKNVEGADLYFLTTSPEIKKMTSVKGQTLALDKWALFADADRKTGEMRKILSIKSGDKMYATNSATFIESFEAMLECFAKTGLDVHHIRVSTGTSNGGREFINCVYAD